MRIAVVGLGPHGRRVISAISADPQLELVGVADERESALHSIAVAPAVRRFTSSVELWKLIPDAVVVATNGPSHHTLTMGALESGVKRVLVEKPMACSLTECDQMIAAAAARGARLLVDQSRRKSPFYIWLRGQIRAGALGELRSFWIQRPGVGLGCLGTHSFDLVRYLSDCEITRVTGWIDPVRGGNPRGEQFADPGGLVVMELEDGARAVVCQLEDGAGPMSVEIDTTEARICIDERNGRAEILVRDRASAAGPNRPAMYAARSLPEGVRPGGDMQQMLLGVLKELASDEPAECDAVHGRAAMEVFVAAHESFGSGNASMGIPLENTAIRDRWFPVT